MSYNIKSKYLFAAILIALCGIFFGGWYIGAQKVKTASSATQNALKDTIEKLTVQINDTEYTLTRTEQELITEKELRKRDILEKKDLKALSLKQANEISRLKLRIDTLLEDIKHNGQIIVVQNSRINSLADSVVANNKPTQKAILLPFTFAKKDQWLDLKGMFDDNGKLGIDLKMDMDVDVITGVAKTKERNVNVLTDSPYIGVINVKSYKTDVQKPKRMGIGAVVGYGVCRNGLSPYIGIGLSYNVIRF